MTFFLLPLVWFALFSYSKGIHQSYFCCDRLMRFRFGQWCLGDFLHALSILGFHTKKAVDDNEKWLIDGNRNKHSHLNHMVYGPWSTKTHKFGFWSVTFFSGGLRNMRNPFKLDLATNQDRNKKKLKAIYRKTTKHFISLQCQRDSVYAYADLFSTPIKENMVLPSTKEPSSSFDHHDRHRHKCLSGCFFPRLFFPNLDRIWT